VVIGLLIIRYMMDALTKGAEEGRSWLR